VITIFKNLIGMGMANRKQLQAVFFTTSCVFHYKNCRASNEAGGRWTPDKQRKWFFVHQVSDKLKSLPKDAMGLQSIYVIFCSAST